jgi:hypothetical protein
LISDTILVAIVGFLGVIIGGVVQSVFSRWIAVENFRRDIKRQLYGSFVDVVWQANTVNFEGRSDEKDSVAREFVQLATKIALYGSPEVVGLLAPIMQNASVTDHDGQVRLSDLIAAMRRDVGQKISDDMGQDIRTILFSRVRLAEKQK